MLHFLLVPARSIARRRALCLISAVALTSLGGTPAFADQQQFNLHCVGTTTMGGKTQPFEQTYMIDLTAMKWCNDGNGCGSVREVDPAKIVLQDDPHDDQSLWIDRSSGKLSYFTLMSGVVPTVYKHDAVCTLAVFSGFPQGKF